ncbi:acetyl-CoA synthetase-like protein [Crepidotus variabilis]|uniref:Acetyl-CoA synthetase-like protein n=1 Tax=Crepidotus variabilis TaxID=179855 RepID=A0A9P6EH39_9AGAR|nr:acetyl-CoA synthetase-like protein [Crepidotus variabilis]
MDTALELNHVALLQHQAKHNGDTILLKLPIQRGSEPCREWTTVTVAEFAADVDRVAIFLLAQMTARSIPPRSVVTLLYADALIQYQDLVYAIALSRASYIPQMCSDMLTHPEIIFGLMEKADSKMILYDPSLEHLTKGCPFPKLEFNALKSIKSCPRRDNSSLPAVEDLPSGSDISFVFLTSGSTSGSPKVVPLTQTVFSIFYKIQIERWLDGDHFDSQDVFLAPGNFVCHIPSMIQYLGCLYTGSCLVQPSKPRFSVEELSNLVKVCGLNRFTTYGTFLAPYIQKAKKDPSILKLLQEMRTVSYYGVPISSDDDDWCFEKGIPATNMYGATEIGLVMSTVPGKPARFLRPEPGVLCRFDPVTDAVIQHDNLGSTTHLVEFILLADSPQIPQPHLRSADGNLRTGDLFEEQPDGSFRFRGRDDDWIKSFEADRIDARAIEAKINDTSSDIVKECVVVGHLRPSPALFVAVRREESGNSTDDEIKETILRRMEDFNARQYVHERITDKRLVFIVAEGVLPRTKKGNFRRRATEQKYLEQLDAMYMSVYGY